MVERQLGHVSNMLGNISKSLSCVYILFWKIQQKWSMRFNKLNNENLQIDRKNTNA